jgi:hypothetical protein
MVMLALYKRISDEEIDKDAESVKADITKWFAANPKRRVCNAQVWYGQVVKVHRARVAKDIDAAALAAKDKNK